MIIKTLQWNIGGGLITSPDSKKGVTSSYEDNGLDHIIKTIKEENPDIITLQEVHDGTTNQASLIANALCLQSCIVNHYDKSHLIEGKWLSQAIISKYPITDNDFSLFPNPNVEVEFGGKIGRSHDKGVSTARLNVNGTCLYVKTLHLIPFGRTGLEPTDTVYADLRVDINRKIASDKSFMLVQGDFNINSESLAGFIPTISAGKMKEIIQLDPTVPDGKRYDHILYRGVKLVSSHVNSKVLTDHFPVISEFEI